MVWLNIGVYPECITHCKFYEQALQDKDTISLIFLDQYTRISNSIAIGKLSVDDKRPHIVYE